MLFSVCETCKGLQKHLNNEQTDTGSSQWVSTSLPNLRASAVNNGCRACTLLLQGILLHHDRFAGIQEGNIRITAKSFDSRPGQTPQDHLSVEIQWKQPGHDNNKCQGDDHAHMGSPNLRLEFFTDGGTRLLSHRTIASHFPDVQALWKGRPRHVIGWVSNASC